MVHSEAPDILKRWSIERMVQGSRKNEERMKVVDETR